MFWYVQGFWILTKMEPMLNDILLSDMGIYQKEHNLR